MDHKKAVETILSIEERYDVNSVRYKGVMVWPVIRHFIMGNLLHSSGASGEVSCKESQAKATAIELLKTMYKNRKVLNSSKRDNAKQLKKLSSIGQRDTLFFSKALEHIGPYDVKYYNPFIDPMVELVKDKYSNLKLELNSAEGVKRSPRYVETELVSPHYYLLRKRLKSGSWKSEDGRRIDGFQALKAFVADITGTMKLDESYFVERVDNILAYRAFFCEILKTLRPKVVFLVCYYYAAAMGLISACRQLGVPSVDIQHGQMGKYGGFYTHWTNVPEEGYEFLPEHVWVWGEDSADNINKWHPEGCRHHRAIIGGNRWLAKWVNGEGFPTNAEERNFFKLLKAKEKVVLITLQPIEKPFSDHVLETMKFAPKSWIWLVRIHPVQVNRGEIEEIRSIVKAQGIDNYEIDISTTSPLFGLLQHVDHHLTAWSTVCYESLAFGVPTTIIHPNGSDIYSSYIEGGIFTYADDCEALMGSIEREYTLDDLKESAPYIETDIGLANNAIELIMNRPEASQTN